MKHMTFVQWAVWLGFIYPVCSCQPRPDLKLWYTRPAERWEETLPLGNGRLGMMPDGGVVRICTLRELFPYSNKLFVNKGIVPDIVIHRTLSSERQNKDLALEKAIEILKKVHNDSLHIEHN